MLEVATANMSLLKQQLTGKLAKKTLYQDEKFKFLDFAKVNPMFEIFKIMNYYSAFYEGFKC